jgi:class 3 adenylate cyclase
MKHAALKNSVYRRHRRNVIRPENYLCKGLGDSLQAKDIDQLLKARSEIDEELRRHQAKVTVLFTDVVGSTRYFDRYGDTAGLLLLHNHDHLVTCAVAEFGGLVIKTIGDRRSRSH